MKRIISVFLLINCVQTFAQDFAIIHSNSNNYFQFDTTTSGVWMTHDVYTNTIDSNRIVGTDTILYPFQILNKDLTAFIPPYCNELYDTSWLGTQIIKKPDSTLFFNKNNEMIVVEKPVGLGQQWTLFEYPNQDYIQATVSGKNIMSVMGNSDSVVTIGLQVYNLNNVLVNSPINNETILISKSNGMVKGFNWNEFPYRSIDKPFFITEHHPLTYGNVYDFNVNDEFHYEYAPGTVPPAHLIRTVLDKWTSGADSITYVYQNIGETQTVDFSFNPPKSTFHITTSIDTVGYGNLSQLINPAIPATPMTEDSTQSFSISELYIKNHNYNLRHREVVKEYLGFYDADSSCYYENSYWNLVEYIKGCGITRSYYDFSMMFTNSPEQLQYFKKGTETWGNPHVLTGIPSNPITNKSLSIYPNPVETQLQIEGSNPADELVEIYDLKGRLVMTDRTLSGSIQVSQLESGIYFLRIIGREGLRTRRFVKK